MHFGRLRLVFREHRDRAPLPVHIGPTPAGWAAITADGTLLVLAPSRATALASASRLGLVRLTGHPSPARRAVALGTPFQLKVWKACHRIPAGSTTTYGNLAKSIRCRSAQAVGQALGRNPLCRIIPCHRVIGQAGRGGFAWGDALKRKWLRSEVG